MEEFNPFYTTGIFLYPLKTLENERFSDVFRGYRKKPVAWNGFIGQLQLNFEIILFSQNLQTRKLEKVSSFFSSVSD